MPGNLTDVNVYTAPLVVPADGDAEAAASVIAGFQTAANRTEFLRNRVLGAYSTGVEYSIPMAPAAQNTSFLQSVVGYYTQSATSTPILVARIYPPSFGLKITSIRARYMPAAAHAGLPATLPTFVLSSYAAPLGATSIPAASVLATATGTYGSTAAYQQVVDISTSVGLPVTIAAPENAVYILTFNGETGANSLTGLVVLGFYASFSN